MASSVFVPTKTRNSGSRHCRKPLFLLVGVVPQTPFSAPWPGLAARSFDERCCPCSAGTCGACTHKRELKQAIPIKQLYEIL
ncbi:hypothetical protein, partial [Bacteroides acidifaciens]|uniref:hypothetical protein n=1 Tax=Bacteroides acidifaciens TaxID=85831 RepID=UPI0027146E08